MLAGGAGIYLSVTKATGHIGRIGPWAYLALLVTLYVASVAGPPAPVGAERLVSIVALCFVLLVPLGSWIDAHRKVTG
jgi:hypothetical protein